MTLAPRVLLLLPRVRLLALALPLPLPLRLPLRLRRLVRAVGGLRGFASSSSCSCSCSPPAPLSLFRARVRGVAELHTLAARLARSARVGDLICLDGPLGVGKSEFVRGYLRALLADPTLSVASPSFLLDVEYVCEIAGRFVVAHHLDAYRVAEGDPVFGEGGILPLRSFLADGICLLEWASRVADAHLPAERLHVALDYVEESSASDSVRTLAVRPLGASWDTRVRAIPLLRADRASAG